MSNSFQPHELYPASSSVHGILQARILEWVAVSLSRGTSWPRDHTQICIAGRVFTIWATSEAHFLCRFSQLWPFPLIAFVSPFKILAQDFSHLFLYVGSSIAFTFVIVVVFLPIFPELVNFLNQYIFFLNSYITSLLFVYFINSFESWILGSLVSPSFYCRNIFLLYGLFPRSSMLWLLYSFLVFEGHEFSYTILSAGDSYGRGAREVFQANRNRACMWIFFYL